MLFPLNVNIEIYSSYKVSVAKVTHESNIAYRKTHLDGIKPEQTNICRRSFAGRLLGFRSMKRQNKCI